MLPIILYIKFFLKRLEGTAISTWRIWVFHPQPAITRAQDALGILPLAVRFFWDWLDSAAEIIKAVVGLIRFQMLGLVETSNNNSIGRHRTRRGFFSDAMAMLGPVSQLATAFENKRLFISAVWVANPANSSTWKWHVLIGGWQLTTSTTRCQIQEPWARHRRLFTVCSRMSHPLTCIPLERRWRKSPSVRGPHRICRRNPSMELSIFWRRLKQRPIFRVTSHR